MRQNFLMLSILGLLAACSSTGHHHTPHAGMHSSSDGEVGTVLDVTDRVFFDFDKSNISSESAVVLDELASALLQEKNKSRKIRIEGRCDERGNREYNLGLGQRRANAVARYLQSHGVEQDRMQLISYGKDMQYSAPDGASIEEYYRINRVATVVLEDDVEIVEEAHGAHDAHHEDHGEHHDAHDEHHDDHDEHHDDEHHDDDHDHHM